MLFLRALYNSALALFLLGYIPLILLRLFRSGSASRTEWERFGFVPRLPRSPRSRVWIHAVSVGELLAVQPLIQQLSEENFPLVISTTTRAGHELALRQCGEAAEAVIHFPD